MNQIKYVSVFQYGRSHGFEYHVSFNRGGDTTKDPIYKRPTQTSLNRLAQIFSKLRGPQPTFRSNFTHLQAYVKERP